MKRLLLFAIAAIFAGPFFAYMDYTEQKEFDLLQKEGVVVKGMIESGETRSGRRGRKSRKFDVSFQTKEGKAVQKNFSVGSSYFDAHVSGDSISDSVVQVRYLPAAPETCHLEGEKKRPGSLIAIGIGSGIAGLLGTLFLLKRRR